MAAVLALVMVPLLAAIGFFIGATGAGSFATAFAVATFLGLGAGVLGGALRLMKNLEEAK